MNLNCWLSILIIVVNYQTSYGQVLSCSYRTSSDYGYTCDLTIKNPNGLNNFTGISGTHLTGKSNNDVRQIIRGSGSNTTNIPSIICETFRYVTKIFFEQIGIQTLDEYSFKNCKNILYLALTHNKFTKIDEKTFSENLELQILLLTSNQLTTLPENVFANHQKLNMLRVNANKIADLPENIFYSLENLDRLDMDNNQIKNLKAEWFENLHKLNILNLNSNQIEELPKNVFSSLKDLRIILLSENKLKVIHSDSFRISPNLTEIYFQNNQIYAIDERFIDNTGVQQLYMTENSCANIYIFDNSTSRQSIRNALQTCFTNYKDIYPDAPTTTAILTTTTSVTTTSKPTTTTSQTLPPGCSDGNFGERVCRLEDKNEELNDKIDELANQHEKLNENLSNQNSSIKLIADDNMRLKNVTTDMQEKIEDILKEKEEIREHFESQIEALIKENEEQRSLFKAALEELQNQMYELASRPCACR